MWASRVFWLILPLFGWVTTDNNHLERLVVSSQGPVRGFKDPGDDIFVFYGIPYATAPSGPDKFKAPLPAPTWTDIFDAVDKRIACPQPSLDNHNIESMNNLLHNENCLIANIFLPETEEKNLPVVVYVHGGAYQVGFGNLMPPRNLVRSKKVIVVTFNYRLGIPGFLCLGTKDVPGNAGMKDQVALLRWVNHNIGSYGGNPDDVTIAGSSAGSSSVDLLMLSPSAQGLFNKVIPESGANIASWSVQIDPIANAKEYARSVGFEATDDIYALEEFYKKASLELLTSTGAFFDRTYASFVFSPCVEQETVDDAFLTDAPYNILKSGNYRKYPLLYGFANMEGLLRIGQFSAWKDKMNANFSNFLPIDLKFESLEQRNEVSKKVKEFYFGDKPVGEDNILSYINFQSDVYFTYSTLRAVNLHVQAGHDKIYLYEYDFVEESAPPIPYTDNARGATHCAQTSAVFRMKDLNIVKNNELSEDFKNISNMMLDIWINFMTTGSPVPEGSSLPAWPPAGAGGSPHMRLGRTVELRGALLADRVRFWDSIYDRHYRVPAPPPPPPAQHTEF